MTSSHACILHTELIYVVYQLALLMGASKGTPCDAKCVTEILGENNEVGGHNLNLVS